MAVSDQATALIGVFRGLEKKCAQLRIGETATTCNFHFLKGPALLRFLLVEQSGEGLIEQRPIVDGLFVFGFRSQARESGAGLGVTGARLGVAELEQQLAEPPLIGLRARLERLQGAPEVPDGGTVGGFNGKLSGIG